MTHHDKGPLKTGCCTHTPPHWGSVHDKLVQLFQHDELVYLLSASSACPGQVAGFSEGFTGPGIELKLTSNMYSSKHGNPGIADWSRQQQLEQHLERLACHAISIEGSPRV